MTGQKPVPERDRVIEAVTRLFVATDRKDWTGVKNCFTEAVFFDMTSLGGGVPSTESPGAIADGWKEGLKDVPVLHHQVGNFLVTLGEREARVFCYGIAIHYLAEGRGGSARTFIGEYDFQLEEVEGDWKITLMVYRSKFVIEP